MSEIPTITRYIAPPGKLDIQPRGTLCVVLKNDEGTGSDLYIQTSHNQDDPLWMSGNELLVSVFGIYLKEPEFIVGLMNGHTNKDKVLKILKKAIVDSENTITQDPWAE